MAASMRAVTQVVAVNRQLLFNSLTGRCIIAPKRFLSTSIIHYGKTPQVNSPSTAKVDVHTTNQKAPGVMARAEKILETRFPKVYKIYMLIKLGMKDFYVDTKTLYSVSSQMRKGKAATEFSYNELDVYRRMPKDLLRVGPIVVLLNLPITDVILPFFVIAFPRYLLSQHFWTPEQQNKFGEKDLQSRVPHMTSVLQALDKQSSQITDSGYRKLIDDIVFKLEQNHRPAVEEILEVKPVFRDDMAFGLPSLTPQHRGHLAKTLGLSAWSSRLVKQARLLHHSDLALHREGVGSLSALKIKQACFLRGLNAAKCTDEEALNYLQNWTDISCNVDENFLSLLLHCPTLMALNNPANAQLLK